jgi:hypothetical protein
VRDVRNTVNKWRISGANGSEYLENRKLSNPATIGKLGA